MTGRISTYGFSLDMIAKNVRLQQQLSDVQQQIATGVKHSTLQGYGVDNLRLQNARINLNSIDSYMFNIQTSTSKIKQMSIGTTEITGQAEIVLGALSILPQEGDIDITNMKELANNAKNIIVDILNSKIGEDYLFSGSDIKNKPITNTSSLTSRIQSQMSGWLDGTSDSDTLLANVGGYTDSQTGYSLGVQSSTSVYVRADDNLEVDYTVKANENGFKDILTGLTALGEITIPDETTDLATREDFFKILDELHKRVQGGLEKVRTSQIKLAAAEGSIGRKLQNYQTEKGFLQTTIEDIQAIDPAEAVVRFQSLQTNLEAAFQATSIISSLSLARLI